jgi:hypothetical protein
MSKPGYTVLSSRRNIHFIPEEAIRNLMAEKER